ncbi:MAG: hypothetical protein H8D54_03785, partial [Candidatus Omnitrophica bacterium]|nr:hypothetical protein [Candidatus Omnitrophota bacterium]
MAEEMKNQGTKLLPMPDIKIRKSADQPVGQLTKLKELLKELEPPKFRKEALLKDTEVTLPQYVIVSDLTVTDKDKNVAPLVSFKLEGVSAQEANDILVEYGVGGLLKFANPLVGNSNSAYLENYLRYLEHEQGKGLSRIWRDGKYIEIADEIEDVKDELEKARNSEEPIQSHIVGGDVKLETQIAEGCKVSLYLDVFSQGGVDFKDKDVVKAGVAVTIGDGEIYVTQRFSKDKYQSFNGVDYGEGSAREYGVKYTQKFNADMADFELSANPFVLQDENGAHLGVAIPVIAKNVKMLDASFRGSITPTWFNDYEPIIVGQLEASKEIFGQKFIGVIACNNKGDVELTTGVTSLDSKKGLLFKASKSSPEANMAQGGLQGEGVGIVYYHNLLGPVGFRVGVDRYKDLEGYKVTQYKGGATLDLSGLGHRKTEEPARDDLEDLRLKSVQVAEEKQIELPQQPQKPTVKPAEEIEETGMEYSSFAKEAKKHFVNIGMDQQKISNKIKGRLETEFRDYIMKIGKIKKGSQDETHMDVLISLFTGDKIQEDLSDPEKEALNSEYAAIFGAAYYKCLLEEITNALTIDNYEDIYELYKIFVNGSFEEEGLDKSVIEAKARLDELKENNASGSDINAALNRLKSRIIMVPPEKFHWQYIDLLHDRMVWVDFDIEGDSRFRPEDVRRFFETTTLLNNGKPVEVDIAGRVAKCIVYNVDYSMLTQDELKRSGSFKPQIGIRNEYYEYDAVSKMQRKVMTVEDYDTYALYHYPLEMLDLPPSNIQRVKFEIRTYHYYIEGTNIERSYQKKIIWKDDYAFMNQKKGDSEIVEMGILRLTGGERYLNNKGNMEMSTWLTFELMRNVKTWRSQLATFGPLEEQLANTLATIPEGKLVLVHRYVDYTKNMDPHGADEVFKKDDERLKDKKYSTITAVYIEGGEI